MRTIAEVGSAVEPVDGVALRPWVVADASVLVAAWIDSEISKWNPVPPEATLALAESWIAGTASQNEASVGIDVVLDRGGEIVGEIGLQIDVEQAIGEVGFWLTEAARGTGLGRTLLSLAKQLASELDLRGLVALVDPANASAIGLLERAGWTEVPTTSERRAFAHRNPVA